MFIRSSSPIWLVSLSLTHVMWKIAGNCRCLFPFCCNCDVLWMSTESKTRMTFKAEFIVSCSIAITLCFLACDCLTQHYEFSAYRRGSFCCLLYFSGANMNHANSFDDITLFVPHTKRFFMFLSFKLSAFPIYCLIAQHFRYESCFNRTICYALLIIACNADIDSKILKRD